MLKATFLGTSASIPTVERGMPSIALKGKELYLWDCGEGCQRQMMKYKVGFGSVKGVFISHLHLDHFLGIYGLIETLRLSSACSQKLPIFAPRGFEQMLINRWDFMDVQELKSGELLKDAEGSISAFKVKHSRESFGFIYKEHDRVKFHDEKAHKLGLKGVLFREIQEKGSVKVGRKKIELEDVTWVKPGRKIAYAGDCLPSRSTVDAAKGADLLIHEATFGKEFEKEAEERNHSTAEQAAQIAKEAGVKQLALTHISGRYRDVTELLKEARAIFPNTLVAEDGLGIEI
ncbi:Ribonuclease Z [uncultured archaeon]|nr:Ribonuclease Z [uncultured archaeon]